MKSILPLMLFVVLAACLTLPSPTDAKLTRSEVR